MREETKQDLYDFIYSQLSEMIENVENNYESNMQLRENNPFLRIERDKEKYMALARSIDSQLGNRLQNIIFYLSRIRYGSENVPNIVLINKNDSTVELYLYYVSDLSINNFLSNANPYKQYIVKGNPYNNRQLRNKLKVRANSTEIIHNRVLTFNNVENEALNHITNTRQNTPVDLIFFDNDASNTFEIKMSGNLYTKNAESNAKEVEALNNIFSFNTFGNHSFFSTCYSNCSDAVRREVENRTGKQSILNNRAFWDKILPIDDEELTYEEFIELYQRAFREVRISERLEAL